MKIKELKQADPRAFDAAYREWCEGEGNLDYDWYDAAIMGIVEDGKQRGFNIADRKNERNRSAFYFSGFWSQGDGASWEGSIDLPVWAKWEEVHGSTSFTQQQLLWLYAAWDNGIITTDLYVKTRGSYSHSGIMQLDDGVHVYGDDDDVLEEGIFKGMGTALFISTFRSLFGGVSWIAEAALKAARDFADEGYKILEEEYEYLTSEECFIECMENDEREFDAPEVLA